jgi:hypothetical protein
MVTRRRLALAERKNVLIRMDSLVYDALARWAGDELRSTTAQIEMILRESLRQAGRLPSKAAPLPRRGRPARPEGNAQRRGA